MIWSLKAHLKTSRAQMEQNQAISVALRDEEGVKKPGSNNGGNKNFKPVSVKPKPQYRLKAKQSTKGANRKTTPSVGKKNVSTSRNGTFSLSNSFEALNIKNSVSEEVKTSNKVTTSGVKEEGQSSIPLVEKINMFEKQLSKGECVLVNDDGKPVKKVDYLGDQDSEDEIKSVDNEIASILASKPWGWICQASVTSCVRRKLYQRKLWTPDEDAMLLKRKKILSCSNEHESSLSGWSGQGYKACPTCNEDTPSVRVLGKTAYVGHRRFLKKPHKWRRSLEFNGKTENGDPPREFGRDAIMTQLARLPTRVTGKHPRFGGVKIKCNVLVELNWTKRSIFYELEYWSFLTLKHNLDVMHIENNVLESILNTLLMNDKSKDTAKARQDLKRLGIRSGLWLGQNKNKKCSKSQAAYSFTSEDRKKFYVAKPLIELCLFFKQICSQTLMVDDMLKSQIKVFNSLCKLIGLRSVIRIDHQELKKVIWYVLHNSPEIDTYRAKFKSEFPNKDMKEEFPGWFGKQIRQRHVENDPGVSESSELFALACGPSQTPILVNSCVVNGVRFVMHSRDEHRTTQNSGICSPGPEGEMYYGQLEQILEFSYFSFKTVLFRDDPDVIHVDNSSDLALFTSLNDLEIAALHIDGQSIDVDAPPDIIDVVDEDDDIIDEEDPMPHDLADSDDEDLVNLDIDDGVNVMSADVARGYGSDVGGDDHPPPHQIPTGCGGCLGNRVVDCTTLLRQVPAEQKAGGGSWLGLGVCHAIPTWNPYRWPFSMRPSAASTKDLQWQEDALKMFTRYIGRTFMKSTCIELWKFNADGVIWSKVVTYQLGPNDDIGDMFPLHLMSNGKWLMKDYRENGRICQVELKKKYSEDKDGHDEYKLYYPNGNVCLAWEVVGKDVCLAWEVRKDVCLALKEFFRSDKILGEVNATLIALIPKITTPTKVSEFRPVACCNVIYKCISKILTNRIKHGLNNIVNINQSAFIPRRHIQDNIQLAQELMRGYNRKNSPKRCAMQIDIQKAYDTVNRRLLEDILMKFGFQQRWQGDPISSYLFTLVMEVFNLIMCKNVKESTEYGYHFGCKDLKLSQLCFAYDLLVLCKGNKGSLEVIKKSLEEFSHVSGLNPNLGKSTIFFESIKERDKQDLLEILPFKCGKLPLRYLGVPLLAKRIGVQDCKVLTNQVEERINCWRNKSLSYAGRARVAWKIVCRPKDEGGLGIKPFKQWNEVLLIRQFWKICIDKSDSWGWKTMLKIRDSIKEHVWYSIGNGNSISVFYDKWCLNGPLCDFISKRAIYNARIKDNVVIADIVAGDRWKYPDDWLSKFPILSTINPPILQKDKEDVVLCLQDLVGINKWYQSLVARDLGSTRCFGVASMKEK
ncbi:histidine kinase 3, partial [Tanacetum coccineum]